jgi:hypothetical protein
MNADRKTLSHANATFHAHEQLEDNGLFDPEDGV